MLMNNFGLYSQYYDLLYQDKDYATEVDYLCGLLQKYSTDLPRRILELGSGTGIHAELMARRGFALHGVELSASMLELARQREKAGKNEVQFFQGDARNYRAGRQFDAVVSLFHVLSYQVLDNDLKSMLETAAVHLSRDGLFVFDFWYGPAVLWQRPSVRVKCLENDIVSVVRIAEPLLHDEDNVVDVNYTIFAQDQRSGHIEKVQETHSVRYLFLNELDGFLELAGFARVVAEEWLSGLSPSKETWGVTVVAKKTQ